MASMGEFKRHRKPLLTKRNIKAYDSLKVLLLYRRMIQNMAARNPLNGQKRNKMKVLEYLSEFRLLSD